MKKLYLILLLFLMTTGAMFAQYDVVDSVNTALQIAREATAAADTLADDVVLKLETDFSTLTEIPAQIRDQAQDLVLPTNTGGDTYKINVNDLPITLLWQDSLDKKLDKADSAIYATQYDLSQVEVSVEGDTLSYTVAEIDSLLGIVASGDSIDYTAAELGLVLDNLTGGTTNQVLTKTDATDFNYSWQPSSASIITKTAYDITEIAYVDTFLVFWVDDPIIIDSIKAESPDSIRIQVGINYATNLFASSVLINGNSTLTSFSDNTLATTQKARLYFTYIGDNVAYLRLKFYWRYQ